MKWIEENSEIKLRLPEIPHIANANQEEYYRRKAILETYDENMDKDDMELDDILKMDFEIVKQDDSKIDL